MAAGPLRRWGPEADTVAKRAVVWSASQLQAGFDYLVRAAGDPAQVPSSSGTSTSSTVSRGPKPC